MFYRENGQFKTTYQSDQQIFAIPQDRWAILAIIAFAFIGIPLLVDEYLFRAILIPFLLLPGLTAQVPAEGVDEMYFRARRLGSQGKREEARALCRKALERSPDYQAARKQSEQAEAILAVQKGFRWPWLTGYADYQWYSESNADWPGTRERATSSVVGLRLNYPLFTGGQTTAKIAQARYEVGKGQQQD